MKQFSKIRPQKDTTSKDEILYKDDYMKIIKVDDYNVIVEKDSVVCIPYLIDTNQIIIRQEYNPAYKYADGQEHHLSPISGQIEQGESPETTLIREIQEEAGIVLRDNFKIEFKKPLFMTKAHSNKYHPCIIILTENDYHEVSIKGDGSKYEKLSSTAKIDIKYINSLNSSDLITEYMIHLFKLEMNL